MQPVQVKPEQLSGNYCNRAIINHSQREFVFDFLFSVHENTVLASRIITNPQHAKQIYETLGKNIKADEENKDIKLLMMTSIAKKGDVVRLEKIGFSAYLTKPIKYRQLYNCLVLLLSPKKKTLKDIKKTIVTRHTIVEDFKSFSIISL